MRGCGRTLDDGLFKLERAKGSCPWTMLGARGRLTHALTAKVPRQGVEEEAIVRDSEPQEELLLLLCVDAAVLKESCEERRLRIRVSATHARRDSEMSLHAPLLAPALRRDLL